MFTYDPGLIHDQWSSNTLKNDAREHSKSTIGRLGRECDYNEVCYFLKWEH